MQSQEIILFNQLKKKIVAVMQESFPGINPVIEEWKGQEIVDFQEELLQKVNAHLSEKWFYTHIKSTNRSLPRIDTLNLLSKYAGYKNWDDFVFHHRNADPPQTRVSNGNRFFLLVPLIGIVVAGIFALFFFSVNTREYKFEFYDSDTKEVIKNSVIDATVFNPNESPRNYLSDSSGNILISTDKSKIRMIIKTPYYRTDTIDRILKKFNRTEKIGLKPNEYLMMLNYFSNMKVSDWQNRREKLNQMIHDQAVIYQVYGKNQSSGIQLFNKEEFIDRLTVPTQNLKNIEVLESKTDAGKIMLLKFRINDQRR